MSLVKKGIQYFRHYGAISTIKQVFDKCFRDISLIPSAVAEQVTKKKYIENLHSNAKDKEVYIMIPCIDWNIPLYQRPHQLATALASRKDSFVLFVSDLYRYDNFCFSKKISDTLYLYSPRMVSNLDEILKDSKSVTVIMCWTRHYSLLNSFKYDKLVYEYIDELQLFYYYNQEMEDIHSALMKKADLTVATASELYEKARPIAKKLILNPNAGDYDFFHGERDCDINARIASVIKDYDCVFGYYGCLASWFDYDVVIEVAKKRKEWLFVLVGYDFDGTLSRLVDANLPNITHIEAQPYKNLTSFVSGFDIQIIPFVLNDITASTSPVKLFEYMASGKPILTSDMIECRKYDSVIIYKDGAEDFEKKAEQLIKLKTDAQYLALLDKEARENTWQTRVEQILSELRG